MARTKKEAVEETNEEAVEAATGKSVTVSWKGSALRPAGSREYSEGLHGKDFRKMAQSFAEKVRGVVA